MPLNAPSILYNGAVIHDYSRGIDVWQRTLDTSVRPVLNRIMEQFPEVGVEIYCGSEPYFIRENSTTDHHRRSESFNRPAITDFNQLNEPWFKVLLAWEADRLDEVEAYTTHSQDKHMTWVRSEARYLEMIPAEATKGHALEQLMDLTGIERSRCVAMGDHLNDLEMIRRAGVGIAVANAHATLAAASNRACCHHNEHAVAEVIDWLERRKEHA